MIYFINYFCDLIMNVTVSSYRCKIQLFKEQNSISKILKFKEISKYTK